MERNAQRDDRGMTPRPNPGAIDADGSPARKPVLRAATAAVAALFLFATCSFGARVAARYFYDRYWPGHPDSFRAETALLPGLSFHAWWGYFWQDREQALIFLSAFCVFTLPQIVALAVTRGRLVVWLVTLAALLVGASALRDIWQLYDSYLLDFLPRKHNVPEVIRWAWKDAAWVTGLSIAGLLAGNAIRMLIGRRRFPAGCCRCCGYDLRVQSALGIPRCPECGTLLRDSRCGP